jgi:adenosylcobinamide-phosphate synthase
MAGALNVQLAGPRVYSGVVVMEPMINGGGRETAVIEDIESAVSVFYASCSVLAFVALVIFLFLL